MSLHLRKNPGKTPQANGILAFLPLEQIAQLPQTEARKI